LPGANALVGVCQTVKIRAGKAYSLRAERERNKNIGATTDTTIKNHFSICADRIDN
jgi:hypothetical protein